MLKKINIKYIIIVLFSFFVFHEPVLIFTSNILSMFRTNNIIKMQEKSYKRELDRLKLSISQYKIAEQNMMLAGDSSLILGKISLRNIYNFYDYLVINTKYTVKNGDEVINEEGLVGFIISHSKHLAKVRLLTGKHKLSIKINNSYGLLEKYNPKTKCFLVTNLKNIETIKEGDIVETSGLSKESAHLYVGKVYKINNLTNSLFVKSDVDFDNLNYLFVRGKRWFI